MSDLPSVDIEQGGAARGAASLATARSSISNVGVGDMMQPPMNTSRSAIPGTGRSALEGQEDPQFKLPPLVEGIDEVELESRVDRNACFKIYLLCSASNFIGFAELTISLHIYSKLETMETSTISSAGITDLGQLLSSMSPRLLEGEYVFVSLPYSTSSPPSIQIISAEGPSSTSTNDSAAKLEIFETCLMSFQEREGWSFLLPLAYAKSKGYSYDGVFKGITLDVHSSLEAVGLTAAVSTALATAGLSANVIAATHHDHVFVGAADADAALAVLAALVGASQLEQTMRR